MTYGFVYFLTNPCMPGVVKIGMTMKHPRERMEELSASTSCPKPFEMLGFFDTDRPREAERAIHLALEQYRVNDRREFFSAPPLELQNQARNWGDPEMGCYAMQLLDYDCAMLHHEASEKRKRSNEIATWIAEHS